MAEPDKVVFDEDGARRIVRAVKQVERTNREDGGWAEPVGQGDGRTALVKLDATIATHFGMYAGRFVYLSSPTATTVAGRYAFMGSGSQDCWVILTDAPKTGDVLEGRVSGQADDGKAIVTVKDAGDQTALAPSVGVVTEVCLIKDTSGAITGITVQKQTVTLPYGSTVAAAACTTSPTDCCATGTGTGGGGSVGCQTCGTACLMPATVTATISGVTNGNCSDCTALNTTHTLTSVGSCSWSKAVTLCGTANACTIELSYDNVLDQWVFSISDATNTDEFYVTIAGASWNCLGSNVFTGAMSGGNGSCGGTVTATVDLSANTCEDQTAGGCGGAGTFPCAVIPDEYKLVVSGLTVGVGSCVYCAGYNGTWILKWSGSLNCTWEATTTLPYDGGVTCQGTIWRIGYDWVNLEFWLQPVVLSTGQLKYTCPLASWNCLGSNTFTKVLDNGYCATAPATLTVTPT